VNTLLDANEAQSIVEAHYEMEPIVYCMLIRRGFNDTYMFATENNRFIFRVYLNHKYFVKSDTAYKFETDLLEHLHNNGVPVCNAIRSKQNSLLVHTETEFGVRACAVFNYADGMAISRGAITLTQAYNYGKIKEAAEVENPNQEIQELSKHGQMILDKLQPLDHYADVMEKLGKDGDRFGIIHADLHTNNLHFHGESLTVFDFDHCAYGWRAYDLAAAYDIPKAHRESVYKGYESVRVLDEDERESIRHFANLRNLWDIGDILATVDMRAQ